MDTMLTLNWKKGHPNAAESVVIREAALSLLPKAIGAKIQFVHYCAAGEIEKKKPATVGNYTGPVFKAVFTRPDSGIEFTIEFLIPRASLAIPVIGTPGLSVQHIEGAEGGILDMSDVAMLEPPDIRHQK